MKKTCSTCGGELFQFTPPPSIRGVRAALLPTACRRCGKICVEGVPLALPAEIQKGVAAVADEAARQGEHARAGLATDPSVRVEKYFDQVYRTGFIHGFVRALAWFSHEMREGRLKRLRRLWQGAERVPNNEGVELHLTAAAFREMDQLIEMEVGAKGAHGAGHPHARSTG